ncbi:MAG: hypothetical protein CML68_05520 [Rhodobacteraceae bacterium]|nr:hypothetical protein [Paracoccaceae bacterium]
MPIRLDNVICVSTTALLILSGAAMAQTASELTPSTFEPTSQNVGRSVQIAAPSVTEAPAGSEKLFVTVGDVAIDGGQPSMADAAATFRSTLAGNTVSVAQVFQAASALEQAYVNAGFVLARVVIPAQRLNNGGTLKINVINGFVEQVDLENAPPEVKRRLEQLTDPLVDKRDVKLRDIERELLLAGDTYGVALDSALATGDQPGGTVIILQPEYKRVTGSFGFDNFVDDDLGPVTLNAGLELNSAFGLGETIYGRIAGSPQGYFSDEPQYRTLAAGFVIPIGTNGMTFNFEATDSQTKPDDVIVPTTSKFERYSARLFYPWIRSNSLNVSTQLIFDATRDEQDLLTATGSTPIYDDQLSVLRLAGNVFWRSDSGGVTTGRAELSQGLDILGASTDASAAVPLSRQGASAEFTKLAVNGQYQRALNDWVNMTLSASAQTSFGDPLLTSEQFSATGMDSLSTFDAGDLQGDDGWTVRAEFAVPNTFNISTVPVVVSPYAFAATGSVFLKQPSVFEQSKTTATSYGIGVDLSPIYDTAFRSASLRLEYGRGERDDALPDGNRFSISGFFRF